MLYLRTASGDFINAATIVELSPQHADSSKDVTGWVAMCEGGKVADLAAYYAGPGRIDAVLGHMPPTARVVRAILNEETIACPSDCGCSASC